MLVRNWDTVKEVAATVWEGVKKVWNAVSTWFDDKVIQPLSKFFSGMWDGLKNGAKNAWDGIKNVFSSVAEFFKNIFSNAWTAVKNVFSTGGKIFDGIKDGIVTAFKTIVNAIIDGINRVIKIPFDGINTALSKIKGIEILGFKPFDWVSTINVPQIPRLATGAVLPPNKPFYAMLGDQKNGTNIEAPLSTIEQAVENVLSRQSSNSQPQTITIKLTGDGADLVAMLAPQIVDEINGMTTRKGKSVVLA